MRSVLFLILIVLSGCAYSQQINRLDKNRVNLPRKQPSALVPPEFRHENTDGSCVYVAWVYGMKQQSDEHNKLFNVAEKFRQKYHGGATSYDLRRAANKEGIRIADTTSGDVRFIDWACQGGRGCIVNDQDSHVRWLAGIDPAGTPNAKAYVLNNHGEKKPYIYGRDEWLSMWRSHGGWAATPVYDPAPAKPWN